MFYIIVTINCYWVLVYLISLCYSNFMCYPSSSSILPVSESKPVSLKSLLPFLPFPLFQFFSILEMYQNDLFLLSILDPQYRSIMSLNILAEFTHWICTLDRKISITKLDMLKLRIRYDLWDIETQCNPVY